MTGPVTRRFDIRLVRLGLTFQSAFGLVPVFGIANIDSPAIQPNRVDGPAGLQQQVHRIREFVLAAVGGLDQVTGVEDGRRERVKAGHHQVRRRVVGFLDHLDNLAVLVGVTDAVPRSRLSGHLLD